MHGATCKRNVEDKVEMKEKQLYGTHPLLLAVSVSLEEAKQKKQQTAQRWIH